MKAFELSTHVFKLTSGVECEVKEFTGEQQDILTRQDGKPHTEKLNALILSILVRVGSKTNFTEDFVSKMIATDKQQILVVARQFSMGFPAQFTYPFEYTTEDKSEIVEEVDVDLPNGQFPITAMKQLNAEGELVPAAYQEYDDIVRTYRTVLPRTKIEVEFSILDGKGEMYGAKKRAKDRSSHTLIEMRNPVYFEETSDKKKVPVSLRGQLGKLPLGDIEHLRKEIKKYEGDVNTQIVFKHPDTDAEIKLDVLGTVVFFFPSGAI